MLITELVTTDVTYIPPTIASVSTPQQSADASYSRTARLSLLLDALITGNLYSLIYDPVNPDIFVYVVLEQQDAGFFLETIELMAVLFAPSICPLLTSLSKHITLKHLAMSYSNNSLNL